MLSPPPFKTRRQSSLFSPSLVNHHPTMPLILYLLPRALGPVETVPGSTVGGPEGSVMKETVSGTSVVVQWLRLHAPNAGVLGSVLGWGTQSHMLQLRILQAAMKTPCSQINKRNLLKDRKKLALMKVGPQEKYVLSHSVMSDSFYRYGL